MQVDMDISSLLATLEGLGAAAVGEGTRRALRAGGNVIKQAMKERAPVLGVDYPKSSALPPGALRDGIRVLVNVDKADGELEALVGPSGKVQHVARWVEFGHRNVKGGYSTVNKNGKTRGKGKASAEDVPPHPFLRPAYEESREAAIQAERESIAETIKKEVG